MSYSLSMLIHSSERTFFAREQTFHPWNPVLTLVQAAPSYRLPMPLQRSIPIDSFGRFPDEPFAPAYPKRPRNPSVSHRTYPPPDYRPAVLTAKMVTTPMTARF